MNQRKRKNKKKNKNPQTRIISTRKNQFPHDIRTSITANNGHKFDQEEEEEEIGFQELALDKQPIKEEPQQAKGDWNE